MKGEVKGFSHLKALQLWGHEFFCSGRGLCSFSKGRCMERILTSGRACLQSPGKQEPSKCYGQSWVLLLNSSSGFQHLQEQPVYFEPRDLARVISVNLEGKGN